MIALQPGKTYKKYQDRFIKRNKSYLQENGQDIKPVSVRDDIVAKALAPPLDNDEKTAGCEKLEMMAEKVSQPLLTMTTLPILQIFPTTITIDLKKVTIDTMTFIKSHSVQTITYDFIREISLETGIISSSLRFVLSGQYSHPILASNFRKKDAVMAKRLILGLMQCHKQQIKTDELDPTTDREKIIALGSAASPS